MIDFFPIFPFKLEIYCQDGFRKLNYETIGFFLQTEKYILRTNCLYITAYIYMYK